MQLFYIFKYYLKYEIFGKKERKAGLSYDEYIFYLTHPNWTRPKPPPPPTKAELNAAFFELSRWTPGSKTNGGMVLNQAGKPTSLPNKQEIDYIVKEAKRLGKKFLTDVEIAEFVKQTKEKVEVESEPSSDSEGY
jgi:hypothetical protein